MVTGTPQSTNPKDQFGRMKPPLHLIPPAATIIESMAMKNGSDKYGPFNWRGKTVAATVYLGAALRHIAAWMDGEENASDSGVHHLGHARASLGIILDAQVQGSMVDDRPIPGKAPQLLAEHTALKAIREEPQAERDWSPQDDHLAGVKDGEVVEMPLTAHVLRRSGHVVHATPVKMRPPKFYIAGPMRGLPQFNFPAFDAASQVGRDLGYHVISPADMDRDSGFKEQEADAADKAADMTKEFVKRDVDALLSLIPEMGDGIALLPGWEKSTGAVAEFFIARWLKLKVVDARTFEPFQYTHQHDYVAIGKAVGDYFRSQHKTVATEGF